MKHTTSLISPSHQANAILGAGFAGGDSVSYEELFKRINAWADALAGFSGRAILFGDNSALWITAFYAALKRGLVVIPVDSHASASDLAYILRDSDSSVLISSEACRTSAEEALAASGSGAHLLTLESLEAKDFASHPAVFDYEAAVDDTALIIYTSGTTGSPKGVMLSFGNLVANMDAVSDEKINIYRKSDRVLMLLPVHHIYPLLGTVMIPLYVGASIVLCPSMSGDAIIRTLKQYSASIIIGVPRLYSMIRSGIISKIRASKLASALFAIAKAFKSSGFSRLVFGSVHRKFGGGIRYMVSGGAALDPAIARDFSALGFQIVEGYGMTEAAPMITFTRPGTMKPGSPGHALDNISLEIIDGEITAAGPNIMQGYFRRPEESAAVLKNGRLYTGDLGEIDAQGYLHITGRRKEIIVLSNGKNINPAELETEIEAMSPAVKECAVFCEQDKLRALVVLNLDVLAKLEVKNPSSWVEDSLLKAHNASCTPYKTLFRIDMLPSDIPRTQLGKIRRFMLPALAAQTEKVVVMDTSLEPRSTEYRYLKEYLESEKRIRVYPSQHLVYDIGLDSLDGIGLQAFIDSSFGVQIPLEDFAKFATLAALSEHIEKTATKTNVENVNWGQILRQKLSLKIPHVWPTLGAARTLFKSFSRLYFRFSARGVRNIPDTPCIFVPNHQSFFDAFFIVSVLKFRKLRQTFFYAKTKHLGGQTFKGLAKRSNIIAIDINKNLKDSILRLAHVLKNKKNLIIFPEGTRSPDGKLGNFKKMFAILSMELNVPIVPVSINGAWDALPRGSRFPKFLKPIRVQFHEPVYPGTGDYDGLAERVRSTIERAIRPGAR